MLYAFLKPLAAAVLRLLFGFRRRGTEYVPAKGPVLLVANHVSFLDPVLIGAASPRPLSSLAKAELFRIPLLGGLLRRLGAYPLRREGANAGALRVGLRILRAGGALFMFPEGTRGKEGVLGPAKPGAGMLAVLGNCPIIPVYLSGSGRAWPRGRWFPRRANVTVTFGPPLTVAVGGSANRKDDYEAVSRAMMAAIAGLRDSAIGPRHEDVGARRSTDSRAIARDGRRAVGGVGVGGARTSPKYTDGRNR